MLKKRVVTPQSFNPEFELDSCRSYHYFPQIDEFKGEASRKANIQDQPVHYPKVDFPLQFIIM